MAITSDAIDLSLLWTPRKPIMESQFWLVWNPAGGAPTCQHGTQELAKGEADRLALKHPGQRFYVMEATGYSTKRECEWVDFQRPF